MQSNSVSHINIPNPEDIFKNLVGQNVSGNPAIGQMATGDVSFALSGVPLQQTNHLEGWFIVNILALNTRQLFKIYLANISVI